MRKELKRESGKVYVVEAYTIKRAFYIGFGWEPADENGEFGFSFEISLGFFYIEYYSYMENPEFAKTLSQFREEIENAEG